MSMEHMPSVQELMNDAVLSLSENGVLQQIVRKQIEKTLEHVINDVFGSYSEFSKTVEKAVQATLQINIESLNLPGYNTLVIETVREKLDQLIHVQGIERLQQQLDEVLSGARKQYALQEIVDAIKGDATDYSDAPGEHMSLHIEYSPGTLTFIYMDSEPDVQKYRCHYGLVVNKDGTVHSVKVEGTELNKNQIMNDFHGVEKLLFQAYATKATITGYEDEDEIDTSYDGEEF